MEKFINSLPKPALALLAIAIAVLVFMLSTPPHTVCDTQEELLQESQKGNLFPTEIKKNKIPPAIARTKEACQLGNSAGSCYEYFQVLTKIAYDVGRASSECVTQLFEINEVTAAMNDGVELMVRLAWGNQPPEPGYSRFGWMQDSEVATFCRLEGVYIRAKGQDAWNQLRTKVTAKLPGEAPVVQADPTVAGPETRKATTMMTEQDIWNRSLFSARCESFL